MPSVTRRALAAVLPRLPSAEDSGGCQKPQRRLTRRRRPSLGPAAVTSASRSADGSVPPLKRPVTLTRRSLARRPAFLTTEEPVEPRVTRERVSRPLLQVSPHLLTSERGGAAR